MVWHLSRHKFNNRSKFLVLVRDIRHIHLAAGAFAGQAVRSAYLFNTLNKTHKTLKIYIIYV